MATWLHRLLCQSARDVESACKTVFQFGQSIEDTLGKYPVQEWEESAWARGLKTGLLRMEGYFFRAGSGKKSPLSFFIRNETDLYVGLRRESITQAATYVSLVTDYGYPRNRTYFETRWMDVAVYSPTGDAWIYAETKANARTLNKLCGRLSNEFAQGIPVIDEEAKVVDDAIMKARHIWKNRPAYFWAVCPTERHTFNIRYERTGFTLAPAGALPDSLEWS